MFRKLDLFPSSDEGETPTLLEAVFPTCSQDKSYPDTENIRGLNLAAAKLTTVQVTKLSLQHKLNKIGMICIAKHGHAEDLYIL
jgi:hypothetical protein